MANPTDLSDQYRFVQYTDDLLRDFYALFVSVHGEKYSLAHFEKKTNTSYTGHGVIAFIAYSVVSNEPAAFYGVYPIFINCNGGKILAAQSADTLTHADHRRRGLFEKLFELTKTACAKAGVKFLIGFPNAKSAPGFKKFGWTLHSRKSNFHLFRKRTVFQRVQNKVFPLRSSRLLQRYIISPEQVESRGFQSDIDRSKAYRRYKNSFSHAVFYRLDTCIIWAKTESNSILIGDINVSSEAGYESVLNELVLLMVKCNFSNLYFSANEDNQVVSHFRKIADIRTTESDFIVYELEGGAAPEKINYCAIDVDAF